MQIAETHSGTTATAAAPLSALEVETIAIFVRLVRLLGVARSIGEIYGLLFVTIQPVSFESILRKLGISAGSASQGLRVLRAIGAINTAYVAGDRRDHYVVETGLRKIVSGLLREKIEPHLVSGEDHLVHLSDLLEELPLANQQLLEARLQTLRSWHGQARAALPLLLATLES